MPVKESQISEEEALQWCREYGPPYSFLTTSAKTGEKVDKIFQTAIKIWKEKQEKLAADSSAFSPTGQNNFHSNDAVDLNNQNRKKSGKCC